MSITYLTKAVNATDRCNKRIEEKHLRINPPSIHQIGKKVLNRKSTKDDQRGNDV